MVKERCISRRPDGMGLLRFNREASNSQWESAVVGWTRSSSASVGSYNWLSTVVSQADSAIRANVTLRTSEPGIVAAIYDVPLAIGRLWESEVLSSTADRWRRIASDLDRVATQKSGRVTNAKVSLILDREHEFLLQDWMRTAQSRLFVTSHRIGPISRTRLINSDLVRPPNFKFKVVYGDGGESATALADVRKLVNQNGAY